ncbi:uncharacterized protein STEHIDRAFT_116824 [Stereum hirsutum FP-91666 SS1]|uniref:Ribonuclease H1 N-terminal domain-containing protein n=1 Tax=Stereum hirsutum (strain FP-91666) TaxID=721885 RepID=R7RVI1_STEHR|nr:uncharacterized protein STEHIDRAFT_116824 [Stereum hirsutum FP-91666 SS1]EIM79046.1 hypothetical protein STEHIDRAFT_116824 [Stereum hirsutum FP-91666 SS1]
MPAVQSRPLTARPHIEGGYISLSSDDSSEDDWMTAYESTNYDGSDHDEWLAAIMCTLTVEREPGVYAVVEAGDSSPTPAPQDSPPARLPLTTQPTPVASTSSPSPSTPRLNRAGKVYIVDVPTIMGSQVVNHWAKAADLTQGVEGAHVRSVVARRTPSDIFQRGRGLATPVSPSSGKASKEKAYSAIVAHMPGVFSTWGDLVRAVFGTPGQVYKKHKSLLDAHIHYADMQRKGLVRAVPYHGRHPLPPPLPTPPGLPPPPQTSKTTYTVTQGRRVGVYREWAEAAAQVLFVRCAVVTAYSTPEDAEAAFALALKEGHVRVRTEIVLARGFCLPRLSTFLTMADGDTNTNNTKGTNSTTENDRKEEEDEDSRYAEALNRLSERVDFFSIDGPLDRVPTYRNHEYECFMQRASRPDALPQHKVGRYWRFDSIFERKCERGLNEEDLALIPEYLKEQAAKVRARGYENYFALPSGSPPYSDDFVLLSRLELPSERDSNLRTAKDIVDDAIDCFEDDESLGILVQGLHRHIRTRVDVVEMLRAEYIRKKKDDPDRSINLASSVHNIAAFAQVLALLCDGIPYLLAAYEDEALIFQGRHVDVTAFRNRFQWDHNSWAPPPTF